jgi:hypothetical protein
MSAFIDTRLEMPEYLDCQGLYQDVKGVIVH